jgi:hypothetical protein
VVGVEPGIVPRWSVPLRLRRDNDGVVLVMNYESQSIFFLNGLAADVLERMDGSTDVDALTRAIHDRYPSIDFSVIERDVESIVNMFVTEGTVVLGTC